MIALYALNRMGSQGEVLGSVAVLDVELGDFGTDDAELALSDLEGRLANLVIQARVEGTDVEFQPLQTGLDLNEAALASEAMTVGRSDNPVSDFFWWISHIGRTTQLQPTGALDAEALDALLDQYDQTIIGEPPFEGSVNLIEGELVPQYPQSGRQIDREVAAELLLPEMLSLERAIVDLPVDSRSPELTAADVDRAIDEATLMLSAPVTLTAEDGTSLTFSVAELEAAFVSETVSDPADIVLGFDPAVIEGKLETVRHDFESEPVDARLEVSGYEVAIVPGRRGTRLDSEETATALESASHTTLRNADLPLREGAEPEITTEDLEALDIRHQVASFTTYHDCCQGRVANIHLIADKVDGAIVVPGETFSLNDHVGQRTAAEGYVPAGTIVAGEIVDTVGGGVSQFATTFYNALFWGGYEDVDHKPHSFYFSRYPEGIEATISWPVPHLKFRNNDESGILIRTEYTDTSITVRFYGNNEGRILAGEQSGGQMRVGVVAEGGPGAKRIRGDRSERFNIREPSEPEYRANPDLGVDESRRVQSPDEGWSLTVTRTITIGDQTTTEEWPVRYLPQQEIIEVHPCKVPGTSQSCPTTTTTPPSTTSTTEPTTTTSPPTTAPPTTN